MAANRSKRARGAPMPDYSGLAVHDVLCPVCRGVLSEPVTLPCQHRFCLGCFNGTVENNSLTCPLCRRRIGSWLRAGRKEGGLVDAPLWTAIQARFRKELQNKAKGYDPDIDERPRIPIASPGEIRKEYEEQLLKDRLELMKQKEAEAKASENLINQLKQQEELEKAERDEKTRLDELLAQELNRSLNRDIEGNAKQQKTPVKKNKNTLDFYLDKTATAKTQCSAPKPETSNNKLFSFSTTKLKHFSVPSFISQSLSKGLEKSKKMFFNFEPSAKQSQEEAKKDVVGKGKKASSGKQSLRSGSDGCASSESYDSSDGYDSSDSLVEEMRYFKPIRLVPQTLPKALPNGQRIGINVLRIPAIKKLINNDPVLRPPNHRYHILLDMADSAFENYKCGIAADEDDPRPKADGSPLLGFNQVEVEDSQTASESVKSQEEVMRSSAETKWLPASDRKRKAQEKLDLQLAMKLHEQLNGGIFLRSRTAAEPRLNGQTGRKNPKRRQATLHEMVAPKKLKNSL